MNTTCPDRLLYSPLEVCEMLGFSKSYLYELMKRGEIASLKAGACRRIHRDEVHAYISRLQEAS